MPPAQISSDLLDRAVGLRPGVVVEPHEGGVLLYHPDTRRYVRLGRSGGPLLSELDHRRPFGDVVATLSERFSVPRERLAPQLAALLSELATHDLVDGWATPPAGGRSPGRLAGRVLGSVARIPRLTVVLVRDPGRLLDVPAAALRQVPGRLLMTGLVLIAVGFGALGTASVLTTPPTAGLAALPAVFAALVLLTFSHELSHALACRVLRVEVRQIGVGLWFYVLPLFYVDHTDVWRLRGRAGRTAISLAGPIHDLIAFGLLAVAVPLMPPEIGEPARLVLVFQAVLLLLHLHPLLPMDGLQALEAALGHANLRGRALSSLGNLVLRTALPTVLARLRPWQRWLYATYGALCLLYVPVLAYGAYRWLTMWGQLTGWVR